MRPDTLHLGQFLDSGENHGLYTAKDALQIAAAMDWKASFIITGNVRDFKRSPIPALAPAAWIKRFEPDLGN